MSLRLNPSQCLLPPRPQPPTQPLDLALGLESHVGAEGAGRGGSLSRPGCQAPPAPDSPARMASQPRSPSPPRRYQGARFDFSTTRAKSKMSNKFSLGLPSPCLPPR